MYHEKLRSLWIFLCKLYQINILIYYICIVGRVLLEDWKTTLWSKWKAVLNREYVNFYKSKSSTVHYRVNFVKDSRENFSCVHLFRNMSPEDNLPAFVFFIPDVHHFLISLFSLWMVLRQPMKMLGIFILKKYQYFEQIF